MHTINTLFSFLISKQNSLKQKELLNGDSGKYKKTNQPTQKQLPATTTNRPNKQAEYKGNRINLGGWRELLHGAVWVEEVQKRTF